MNLRLVSLFMAIAMASAFTAPHWGVVPSCKSRAATSSSTRFMFSGDSPPPLKEVSTEEDDASAASKKGVYKNLGRGGEVKEVEWTDPAMMANTNPWDMDWWAYAFVSFPVILLANDALHFLPAEGPLAFLNRF